MSSPVLRRRGPPPNMIISGDDQQGRSAAAGSPITPYSARGRAGSPNLVSGSPTPSKGAQQGGRMALPGTSQRTSSPKDVRSGEDAKVNTSCLKTAPPPEILTVPGITLSPLLFLDLSLSLFGPANLYKPGSFPLER